MTPRDRLKSLHVAKREITDRIKQVSREYVDTLLPCQHGIYITDHAIVRYLERVQGVVFDQSLDDQEKLFRYGKPEETREVMLTIDEDRLILRSQITYLRRGHYSYVVEGLAIITVILN